MLTIRRSFVPFALVAFSLAMLVGPRALGADQAEKPAVRSARRSRQECSVASRSCAAFLRA